VYGDLQRGSGFLGARTAVVNPQPALAIRLGKLELAYPTLMAADATDRAKSLPRLPIFQRSARSCSRASRRLPRLGNPTPRLVHTPAGMINAIGLQNPGIEWYLERELHKYAGRPV